MYSPPNTKKTTTTTTTFKGILRKSKRKTKKQVNVTFSPDMTILERDGTQNIEQIPEENDDFINFDLLPMNRTNSYPISTKKLKKISQKGLNYLMNDKKTRRKQELQKLVNSMHKRDAAEERKQRVMKINKKLGYPINNSAPIIVRSKKNHLHSSNSKNKSDISLATSRLVIPCQFRYSILRKNNVNNNNNNNNNNNSNLRNSNSDNNNNNINNNNINNDLRNSNNNNNGDNNSDQCNNNVNINNDLVNNNNNQNNQNNNLTNSNENNIKEEEEEEEGEGEGGGKELYEKLWMEHIGDKIFGLFPEIKDQMIISNAKYFLQTYKLIPSNEENEISFKFIPLTMNQIISIIFHGNRDFSNPKNNKNLEIRKGIIKFDVPKVKDHWSTILFPSEEIIEQPIARRGRRNSDFNPDDHAHYRIDQLKGLKKNSTDDISIYYHDNHINNNINNNINININNINNNINYNNNLTLSDGNVRYGDEDDFDDDFDKNNNNNINNNIIINNNCNNGDNISIVELRNSNNNNEINDNNIQLRNSNNDNINNNYNNIDDNFSNCNDNNSNNIINNNNNNNDKLRTSNEDNKDNNNKEKDNKKEKKSKREKKSKKLKRMLNKSQ